ncbi:GH116 family glycosyl-hydrolase [Aporhodopirellula aestuarii]|uniref:Non-lysosomal glucosylceramidase n=1 Tax=Aporhodopirellula aestuarii TaxID=2950107 RepID=A0ABT0U7T5_9BACT|nr:GH116 family glycosyl-hydrolase [Aporhodopirellula aestuarii]MCM2372846.1 non-lysosomal glucosylceramidase [Aporhodopirellula aestuarii]
MKKESTTEAVPNTSCCSGTGSCTPSSAGRRDFIKASGLTVGMLLAGQSAVMAGPFTKDDFEHIVPADKKLSKEWIDSLYARGKALSASGKELKFIGMPVSGIATGQVYLGGDGRLWYWNLDGEPDMKWEDIGKGYKYLKPDTPHSPMDQGFALQVGSSDNKRIFTLDSNGFRDIRFTNQYPMGNVTYADADCPVNVELEAYTPFIPLNRDDSSYPVIVMRYTIENTSDQQQEVAIAGWIENFSNYRTGKENDNGVRQSQYRELEGLSVVECWAKPLGIDGASGESVSENVATPFALANDFGAVAMGLLGDAKPDLVDTMRSLPGATDLFDAQPSNETSREIQQRPFSDQAFVSMGRSVKVQPGESKTIAFTLSWRFPNARHVTGFGRKEWTRDVNYYSTQWPSASDSAATVAAREKELRDTTQTWVDTWYDSTLPYWFLERSFIPIDCMQTQLAQRLALQDGRYALDEGVTCCEGNCTHVWHYAQGLARLFPVIERECRDKVDFGLSFKDDSGAMNFRCSTKTFREAVDGQCGTILRVLRESQMTTDYRFLESIWERTRLTMDYVIKRWDKDQDGLLSGDQHNTLDKAWNGKIHWLINLYHAALKASAQMARQMDQPKAAERYESLVAKGAASMVDLLWNEDFGHFVHIPERKPEQTIGSTTGCHIDQVLGEFWLRNLGLDPVLPQDKARKALASLWKYNFSPNVGDFRAVERSGRWFAAEGDAGLIMCTFPHGKENAQKTNFHRYFNECMSGFEWQVSATMIWEGMLEEGLAIGKAIYDRYLPKDRNPYNEVECGDHYSRALASYSAFMAMCGYRYDGPEGKLGFGPRMQQENFRAAFTTAEGWGRFSQTIEGGRQDNTIELRYGKLSLKELTLDTATNAKVTKAKTTVNGRDIEAQSQFQPERAVITFAKSLDLSAGQTLQVKLS